LQLSVYSTVEYKSVFHDTFMTGWIGPAIELMWLLTSEKIF